MGRDLNTLTRQTGSMLVHSPTTFTPGCQDELQPGSVTRARHGPLVHSPHDMFGNDAGGFHG
mgnify:CR=1 FL=1